MFSSVRGVPLHNFNIADSWSDEELVRFLAERKAGDPLPGNVLVGIDISLIDPQGSSGNIWYLKCRDNQQPCGNGENDRKARNGYWKSVDVLRIPTSTAIVGVKNRFEFYEGQAPSGKKTGWVMHEYKVEKNNEPNLPQEYQSLCTVFLQGDKESNAKDQTASLSTNALKYRLHSYLRYLSEVEKQNIAANSQTVSSSQRNSFSSKEGDECKIYTAADAKVFADALANDDYIEINDLLNSEASASTSEYSSRPSVEYFDPDELLNEILNDPNTSDELLNEKCKIYTAADAKVFADALANDDYIEINDLLNSEASASTSEYSSRPSVEYFDPDELLNEILNDRNTSDEEHNDRTDELLNEILNDRNTSDEEHNDSTDEFLNEFLNDRNTSDEEHKDGKFSIVAPAKSDHVFIIPPEQGLVHNHDDDAIVAGPTQEISVPDGERDQHANEECLQHSPSTCSCFPSSHVKRSHSSSSDSSEGSNKSAQKGRGIRKVGKIGKKYCCFGSF